VEVDWPRWTGDFPAIRANLPSSAGKCWQLTAVWFRYGYVQRKFTDETDSILAYQPKKGKQNENPMSLEWLSTAFYENFFTKGKNGGISGNVRGFLESKL
jgi:hypothetical protein